MHNKKLIDYLHGGGGSYVMYDTDVQQGLSNPYPLQTNILAKFLILYRRMVEHFWKYSP